MFNLEIKSTADKVYGDLKKCIIPILLFSRSPLSPSVTCGHQMSRYTTFAEPSLPKFVFTRFPILAIKTRGYQNCVFLHQRLAGNSRLKRRSV